jgi:hypothetical protein
VASSESQTRRFGVGRPWHRPYLLSGLIECGHCGKHLQAKRLTRGRVPAYYLCGGYVASGVAFCNSPRIATTYLEDAVLEGIQKRLDLVLDAQELGRRVRERLADDDAGSAAIPELEAHLHETQRRIERLVIALAAGSDDLPSVRSALVGLERERERLEQDLAHANERAARPYKDRPEQVIAALLESLGNIRHVLEAGSAEERRRLSARSSTGSGSTKRDGRRFAGIACRCRVVRLLSWWRWEELNLRHGAYETPALPLSYTADPKKSGQLQHVILPRTRRQGDPRRLPGARRGLPQGGYDSDHRRTRQGRLGARAPRRQGVRPRRKSPHHACSYGCRSHAVATSAAGSWRPSSRSSMLNKIHSYRPDRTSVRSSAR